MRHIANNSIINISASSENPNFPAIALSDYHPKRVWKALSGYAAVLTLSIVGGCTDIMVAGTNALTASITVTDPNEIEWESGVAWESGVEWAVMPPSPSVNVIQRSSSRTLWLGLSQPVSVPCIIDMTLTCDGDETLYAGVVTAGIADEYGGRNPKYGVGHSRLDYGILSENSNGSMYYKQRDNVRAFSVSGLMQTVDAIRLLDTFSEIGYFPSAWKLTEAEGNEWVIFGRFSDSPSITHDHLTYSNISFSIIEVL